MLDVVEQHEQRLAAEVRGQRLCERCPPLFAHRERLSERRKDELRIAEWREWHPEHAVGKDSEACAAACNASRVLPVPPGPVSVSRRDRRRSAARPPPRAPLAPEEGRRRDGQVRAVQRREGRKVAVSELVDALWRGQVLEPVLAEILQLELDELRAQRRRRGPARRGRPPRCGRRGARRLPRSPRR